MKTKMKLLAVTIAILILAPAITGLQTMNLQSKKFFTPIRVACVGDSITQNSGYPYDLQALLGANFSVGNFGVSQSTVLLNSFKPYMDQPQFQMGLDFQPQIVIIMLGTNDDLQGLRLYNESFENDYEQLVGSFQRLTTKPQIWIMTPPPIFSNSSDLSPSYLSNTIIPMTQNVAHKMGLPTIDVYDTFIDHPDYFLDGVHPNSQGAELIAKDVYDKIDPLAT